MVSASSWSLIEGSEIFLTMTEWPLTAVATSVLFIGSIFQEWFLIWASFPVMVCLIGWFWPKPPPAEVVGPPDGKIPGALA